MELSAEEKGDDGDDMVGYLHMSLYGTRDAAANFQKEVKTFMESIGFSVGRYNPSTFYHRKKGWPVLVHGDDFVTAGGRRKAKWFREKLQGRFGVTTTTIGNGEDEEREGKVLNRIIRVTPEGEITVKTQVGGGEKCEDPR